MKKLIGLLALLCLLLSTLQAQTIYFNYPDTVCMTTNTSTADQAKFISINAGLSTGLSGKPSYSIVTPSGSSSDYSILYSENTSTVKDTQLTNTTALTIQLLTAGTYTITVTMTYKSGSTTKTMTQTGKVVALDCTMSTCNGGNAEMPGFTEDFGTLPSNTSRMAYSPSSAITYIYQATGDLKDNYYAISNTTHLKGTWFTVGDHTGSTNGGMLVANCDYTPSTFFQKEVDGLCRGSVYNFSAYLLNIDSSASFTNTCLSGYKYAGVTFQILNAADTSQMLASFRTYAVSMNLKAATWQRYGGSFTVPSGVTNVIVRIKNDRPGGCGNDIAIDDISFSYCSPTIIATIEGDTSSLKEVLCEGAPTILTASYTPTSYFTNAEYQWEMSDDGGVTWFDVPYGTANNDTLVIAAGELKGTKDVAADYYFRSRIYESGSSSQTCAAPSSAVKITILPVPTLYLTKSQVCAGAAVELQASGGYDEFRWSDTSYVGPNRSITLIQDTTITVTGYIHYGIDGGKTCASSNSASIKVDDAPVVDIAASDTMLCVGSRITLAVNDALAADTITWYKGADTTGVHLTDFDNSTTMTYTTETVADSVFTVKVVSGTCTVVSSPFHIHLTDIPAPAAGKHVISCVDANSNGSFTMTRTPATGTTGTWQVISISGPGLSGNTSSDIDFSDYVTIYNKSNPKTIITLDKPGITAYLQWTVKATANTSCVGYAYDTLTLMTEATQAYAGEDQTQCGSSNVFTLAANEENVDLTDDFAETGTWTLLSGTATIADSHAYNTTVTVPASTPQTVTLQWSIANAAGCGTSYDTVALYYKDVPTVTLKTVTTCNTTGTFTLDTTATSGGPAYYSIAAASTGAMPGFAAVPETAISAWPVTVTYPANTAAGIYNFLLTVRNDSVGCTNTIPFSVNVYAPPTDPASVTVGSPNICTSGTSTLTVTGGSLGTKPDGTADGNWVWYAGACGTGTAIGTGTTITVSVAATTTYYVRAEGTGPCTAGNCASGTVTVYAMPATATAGPDQEHCNDSVFIMKGSQPDLGTGTWTVKSGTATIVTPSDSVSAVYVSPGNTATLTWTITNGVCITADDVVLTNDAQPAQANAGPDSIKQCNTVAFVMSATAASPATATGTWSFYAGSVAAIAAADLHNPTATITVPVGDTATAIWTVTNGSCSSTDYVKLFNYATPTTADAGADTIKQCMTSAFTMAATAPTIGTGKWSVKSGTPTIATTDSSNIHAVITVPDGANATLYWTVTNGVCAAKDSIYLVNYQQPDAANAGLDAIVQCNNPSFTMAATAPAVGGSTVAGVSGQWSLFTGSAASFPSTDSSKINAVFTLPAGDTATAIWTVTNGTCSSTDYIFLKNYEAPAQADAGVDSIRQCNTANFTMAATAPSLASAVGTWTVSNTAATISNVNSTTATITVPAGDSTWAYWTIVNGTCSTKDSIKLVNYIMPDTANAGADQHQCNTASFTMAANAPSVATASGTWSLPAGTTAVIANIHNPATTVTIPVGDSTMLFWTITNGVCVDVDTVLIANNNPPANADAGADSIKQCNSPSFTLAANAPSVAGATGYWTVISPSSYTFPAADINNPTATINISAGTTVILRWTITNIGCTSTDSIVLINYEQPTSVSAGPDQTRCAGSAFVMAASVPAINGAVGTWVVVSGTATITTGEEHLNTAHVTVPNDATAVLRWIVSNGTCADSADVALTNYLTPVAADAGADTIKQCSIATFVMNANAPDVTGAAGKWTFILPATATVDDDTLPTATITVPAGDSVYAIWTISNGTCSTSDTVKLVNYQQPTDAAVPADMHQCMNTSFNITANAPDVTGAIGYWTIVKGTATIPAADINNNTITATVPNGDSAWLSWTITNGTCTSADTIRLYNYQQPDAANAGLDSIVQCNTASFTMAATAPAVMTGKWSLFSGSAASFASTDSGNINAVFTLPAGDTATAIWTVTNGTCSSTDYIFLKNYEAPAQADAGVDAIRQCNTASFTMAASAPSLATAVGTWTVTNAAATISNVNSTTATVTVPAGDSTWAYWTIVNGTCSTKDSIKLVNYIMPAAANAGPDQRQCNTATFTMAANAPSVATATGSWTVSDAASTISSPHSATTIINVPAGDSVTAWWTITNGTCSTVDSVKLVNYIAPTAADAGTAMTHCNDSAFTMAANTPSPATATGTWSFYPGTTATIAAADINNPTGVIFVPAGDTATAIWTITNGVCSSVSTVFLRNYRMPAKANAGADQSHCNDSLFTMTASNSPIATAQGTWSVISGTATIAATDLHNATANVFVLHGVSAALVWTITNGTCTGIPDTVLLTNLGPVLGNTISASQTLCSTETPAALTGTATLSGGDGTFTYQWQMSTTSATTGFSNVTTGTGGTSATYQPASLAADTVWFKRIVTSGACSSVTSNVVKLQLIRTNPVVVSVPAAITTNCVAGKDYTTLFGTPVFSHAPYTGEALTVTYTDYTSTPNSCTTVISRTWTAVDRCGLSASAQQTITVVDTSAPVFTTAAPADVTVDCDKVPALVNLTANDACSGTQTIIPTETRVDIAGQCTNNYYLVRKWVAVDNCGNVSDTLKQTITVKDMTAPVFNGTAPANVIVDCDKVPTGATMTATDNCTAGTITVTPVDTRQNISGSTCTNTYQITRTWTAADDCGNTTVLQQIITVQDTTRPVFSVTLAPTVTIDCDKVPTLPAITATDNCSANVKVTVAQTKVFLSTTCSNNYQLTRTWTATDDCGNKATMKQVILVQDTTRPGFTVAPPGDTTVSCDAIPNAPSNLTATDNCSATSNVKISYTQTRQSVTGATCASNYQLIRTWVAKDECGNSNTVRQVITVVDTTKPVIDPAPAAVTIDCGGTIPTAATLYATDNCDGNFPKRATMTTDPYTVDPCNGYQVIRRWNVTDACGNAAVEQVQIITVNACPKPQLDTTLPVNCSDNTKFAILLLNKVSKPAFTLQGVYPTSAVSTPLTQTSNVFDLHGATQATFVVTDGVTGCVSDPVTYNLQYLARPTVNLGNDTAICQGNTVTLDAGAANAGYTIRWNTGATTQQITVSATGTYYATVSNNGCSVTDSIKVTVNTPPAVDIRDTTICEGNFVKLNAYVKGAAYVWNTGDTGPSITVNTADTYTVTVFLGGCIVTNQATVTLATAPDVTLTSDTSVCPGQSVTLVVEPDGGSVVWSDSSTIDSIIVSRPGDYWVTVTRNSCVVTDTVTVSNRAAINEDLGPDKEICTGGLVVLDATNPDAVSYLWNDGTTDPIREVSTPGTYTVTVMDRYCGLLSSDSVVVTVAGIPGITMGNDTVICIGQTLTLTVNAGSGNSIRWQDGSTSPTYIVGASGYYTVTVYNDCGAVTDGITVTYKTCEANPIVPNAFTPNGDGKNDTFKPHVSGTMYDYDLRIYNRWGELIFVSNEANAGWDGRFKGVLVDEGTYVWLLTYKKKVGGEKIISKGVVTIVK